MKGLAYKLTHKSPKDPLAIFSPIFNNLSSISHASTFRCVANMFSTAEEWDEPDHDPYILQNTNAECITIN